MKNLLLTTTTILVLLFSFSCEKEEEINTYILQLNQYRPNYYTWVLRKEHSGIIFSSNWTKEEKWDDFIFTHTRVDSHYTFKLTITDTTHVDVPYYEDVGGRYTRVPGEYKFQKQ